MLGVLQGGVAGSKVIEAKREKFLRRDFAPGFRVELHHKDLGIALAAGGEYGVSLPVTEVVRGMLEALEEGGSGGLDHSAILTHLEGLAGHRVGA